MKELNIGAIRNIGARAYQLSGRAPRGTPIWRLLNPAPGEPRSYVLRRAEGQLNPQAADDLDDPIHPRCIARAVWAGPGRA
jgi:hypothetical protein